MRSSLSRNVRYVPRACAMPWFLAADTPACAAEHVDPRFVHERGLEDGDGAVARTIVDHEALERGCVWARTLRTESTTQCARSCTGTTTLTIGSSAMTRRVPCRLPGRRVARVVPGPPDAEVFALPRP